MKVTQCCAVEALWGSWAGEVMSNPIWETLVSHSAFPWLAGLERWEPVGAPEFCSTALLHVVFSSCWPDL